MHNASIPTDTELPSSRQLVRSTVIALAVAGGLLVTVILPAEYGVDPTGIGRPLGLTEMGEIKAQLAREADADRASDQRNRVEGAVETARANVPPAATQNGEAASGSRSDQMTITLRPGEGAEVKLTMRQGARADFSWSVSGGVVNFDLHADGGGRSTSYEQGRGVARDQGVVEAAFDGNHGWFWRNRGSAPVTVTLRTNGAYSNIRRVV